MHHRHRTNTLDTLSSFTAGAALLLALASCSGDGARSSAGATDASSAGSPAAAPSPAPPGAGVPQDQKRPLDPEHLAQFVTPLPRIPTRTPDTTTVPGAEYYVVTARQGVADFGLRMIDGSEFLDPATGEPLRTVAWGYDAPYLGPTIEARSGRPVVVKYVNDIRDEAGNLATKHILPYDHTLHGADETAPEIRIVTHLHGGHSAPEFDGFPTAWFTNDPAAPANGTGGPAGNSAQYTYDNSQDAATLWFHDHALGTTRLNAYAGLASFYILRDDLEDGLNLPRGDYEVPLVIQDKSFNDDGSLAYDLLPLINPYTSTPLLDPSGRPLFSSRPEMFGNVVLVNGKAWPYLEVEPRYYRLRLLNGSDSRVYSLWLSVDDGTSLPMKQIGADAGLLPRAVYPTGDSATNGLLLAPAERADVIIDFSDPALRGHTITLRNEAPAPYPDGDLPDGLTTGRVMQFRVTRPASGPETASRPSEPRPRQRLSPPVQTRVIDLQELADIYQVDDGTGPVNRLELYINDLRFQDPVTETPRLDTVEDWVIVNATADAHPMHLHLVQFEVIEKGTIPMTGYTRARGGDLPDVAPGSYAPDVDRSGNAKLLPDGSPNALFDGAYTVAPSEAGRKDTVLVPPGDGKTNVGYVRIRAKFDRLGRYVYHCHILSHEEHDMMRPFEVVP